MKLPRLKLKYQQEIIPSLQKMMNYTSPMQVPRLEKICINQGLGAAVSNQRLLETALQELTLIAGQKAVATKAKKAISNFKLRAGIPVGGCVTLRGKLMYEFLDRLVTVALPRVRDFKGINPKAFDNQANYTLGIKEQIIFPEISIDRITKIMGMNITFVTSTTNLQASYELLKALGLPFQKKE